jgi:DNA mismatch repair protein MutS
MLGLSVTNSSTTFSNDSTLATQTPLMRQYTAARSQNPDALLFFRLGDFYELFFEDAVTAARELQITLTSRDRERNVPMCGVPYHAAEGYIAKLLRAGYRVAICEQMEDPKQTKKIVRREVTRVLSPGTALDPTLGSEQNNFLAAMVVQKDHAGLALLDLSTGDFRATEFHGAEAAQQCLDEIQRIQPSELLLSNSMPLLQPEEPSLGNASARKPAALQGLERIRTRTGVDEWAFSTDYALPLLTNHFKTLSLDGFGLSGHTTAAIAAGVILHYVKTTQQGGLDHIDSIRYYERTAYLELDAVSVRNLELVEPIFSGESQQTTLFHALDACQTPMGKRLLRNNLLRPLLDRAAIDARLDAVAEAHLSLRLREALRRSLEGLLDLERLLGRVALDSAGPRDLLALGNTLNKLPAVRTALQPLASQRWQWLAEKLDALEDLASAITRTIAEEAPVHLADGGAIRAGLDAELDELRGLSHSGRQSIAAIEERERARTGIGSLKVRFNSVFGYYIEVTKANLAAVPADYERKQTLVNAERFTTPELKEYETKILTAQDRSLEIERRIFAALRAEVLQAAGRIRETARRLAEIDILGCFAHLAAQRNYVRPQLEESTALEAVAARHPVVEQRMEEAGTERFIPNSLFLDAQDGPSVLLLTGPNMGGKSTYLRQTALLVILAQIGCFVPAESMRLGLVDRIYTRIGASDNVARGRSTFMVEMTETATILNTATARSLVLLDEMGRGTATYDGLSLAWATVEHLHNHIGARTLFATHYHELTLLAEQLPRLRNLRVAVQETHSGIVFLHAVEPGAANKSYGIEVARLAGLPQSVIERARRVLKQHERAEKQSVMEDTAPLQMTMFTPLSQRIVDRLQSTDINSLTPLQALNLLEELQRELAGEKGGNA